MLIIKATLLSIKVLPVLAKFVRPINRVFYPSNLSIQFSNNAQSKDWAFLFIRVRRIKLLDFRWLGLIADK
jgi:hypothetical protein